MFKRHRHILARENEWVHVHRSNRPHTSSDLPGMIGMAAGILILVVLAVELIKATYPYLIAGAVIAVIVHFVRKSS